MNRKQILAELMKHGIAPKPEEMEKLNGDNISEFLSRSEVPAKPGEGEVSVRLLSERRPEKLSIEEFVKMHNRKYELLKEVLSKKTDAVSVNKARGLSSPSTVIVRVKDTTEKGFLVEDPTGEAEAITEERLGVGDVVAVDGFFRENRIYPERVMYPDIPLGGERGHLKGIKITLTNKAKKDTEGIMITTDSETGGSGSVSGGLPGPVWAEISSDGKRAIVLGFGAAGEVTREGAELILKKRMLPSGKDMDIENVISPVPDVFWIYNNTGDWTRNYKGVVIISTKGGRYAVYDTSTNQVSFGDI